MSIIQVNQIVNSIVGQALGKSDIVGTDTSFVSLGDEILSSDKNTEAVYGVMIDRIGRTVSSIRAYRGRKANLRRNPMEWGVVLQKLSMPLSEAVENPSWLGVDDTSDGNVLAPANKQKPTQKLFNKVSTWEYDATIWNKQLRTAFTSPEAMMAFIDMIFTAVYNSQEASFENLDSLCRANFIAQIKENGEARAINLLDLYNTQTKKALTVANCLHDSDFLIFCAMTISLYSQRMETIGRTFNDGTIDRHTPHDLQNMTVLADFSKAMDYAAKSKTYHDNIVTMPMYTEVPFWQGSGKRTSPGLWTFENTSHIIVENYNSGSAEAHEVNGVVALLADYEAMGTTIQNMSTSSMYNPRRKFTNYFMQADLGYYNDLSENGIIFYIE